MYNISVQRLPEDPEAQGVVRAQDGSWELVVDKDGCPHLSVRAKLEPTENRPDTSGLISIEMFLQDGMGIRDIMLSTFGGEVTDPKEIEEAQREWGETKKRLGIPCPK